MVSGLEELHTVVAYITDGYNYTAAEILLCLHYS